MMEILGQVKYDEQFKILEKLIELEAQKGAF